MLETGLNIITQNLETMPNSPGIYKMLDKNKEFLYIGKAKNLRKRLISYTKINNLNPRIKKMVSLISSIEINITKTEIEALLLESNLIKKNKPRFNILLRDDKSFPYILLRKNHRWPQIIKHRGKKSLGEEYYGPFASAVAVNKAVSVLQKAFPLRSCSDQVLNNRTRPCLEYQIKRCSGPCVGRIEKKKYDVIVNEARNFLKGRSKYIQVGLSKKMQSASNQQKYETAAAFRDRLQALTFIQTKQNINLSYNTEADVIATYIHGNQACVNLTIFRAGQHYGSKNYFFNNVENEKNEVVLEAFISQFYQNNIPPKLIIVNINLNKKQVIEKTLSKIKSKTVKIEFPIQGYKKQIISDALNNSKNALIRRINEKSSNLSLLNQLKDTIEIKEKINKIEVYDNSHVSGSNQVGAMIVFGSNGFEKNNYRKFTIKSNIKHGDDYGMMKEVLTRRIKKLSKDKLNKPDLIILDGGKGQLNVVKEILDKHCIKDIAYIAIAKGKERKAGNEKIINSNGELIPINPKSAVFFFIQRLRDESHRFAINFHRAKRSKSNFSNPLDEIPGIGAKRKKALLHHFGSAEETKRAGLNDLERVDGISKIMAQTIYNFFHDNK